MTVGDGMRPATQVISAAAPSGPSPYGGPAVRQGLDEGQSSGDASLTLRTVVRLAKALDGAGVRYCHWKSNEALARSQSGENDLDLLVRRSDAGRFVAVLHELGFRHARTAPGLGVPGVFHTYALDEASGRLVHVHAQYQLVLGDDTTKNVRLPIERHYLASARHERLLPVPHPAFEYLVFVIRMVLKHCPWDAVVSGRGRLTASERRELRYLEDRIDAEEVGRLLEQHLPFIDWNVFVAGRSAIGRDSGLLSRWRVGRRMTRALSGCGRRPPALDVSLRLWRRCRWGITRRYAPQAARKRFETGGLLIGVVGGDGAGKSSAVDMLERMLSTDFATWRIHLGKPEISLFRRVVRIAVISARRLGLMHDAAVPPWADVERAGFPGYAYLLWHLAIARDRYRMYAKARRRTAAGALVVSDRYPLTDLRHMDSVRTGRLPGLDRRPFGRWLARREARYYERILTPDLLIVLRVDPDTAVTRSGDEPESVRRRASSVWEHDWTQSPAVVVDAGRPLDIVHREIRRAIWDVL